VKPGRLTDYELQIEALKCELVHSGSASVITVLLINREIFNMHDVSGVASILVK
jgi:hypothetical protein